MHPDPRPSGGARIALLAITVGLALVESTTASAMTPPSPGLRVVWEKDGSIDGGAATAAARPAEAGQWPRVARIDARSSVRPPAVDGGPGLDVRGRQLPDRRGAESASP